MGAGAFLRVLARNFDVLAGFSRLASEHENWETTTHGTLVRPLIALAYPLYASVKAIESQSPVDDQQWLTYWVLHSLLTLFELTFAMVIEWLPFWPFAKFMFSCWLVLPYFNGAAFVYEHYVRPLVMNQQTVNIWYIPRKKSIFGKPDGVLSAAEKFIEENGVEAFEKLINKARNDTAPKSTKSNKRVTFDADETKRESKSWKSLKLGRFGKMDTGKKSKPSNNDRHVTFDELKVDRESGSSWTDKTDSEKESKPSTSSNRHVTFGEMDAERESNYWINSNYMIFDDESCKSTHLG